MKVGVCFFKGKDADRCGKKSVQRAFNAEGVKQWCIEVGDLFVRVNTSVSAS